MNIDPGLAVVIVAVLFFYLRLIGMQRERARRAMTALARPLKTGKKEHKPAPAPTPIFSIMSRSRLDLWISGAGALAVLAGMALNAGWIPIPVLQTYWWIPTAVGIVAFSWAFKVPREDPYA